jgi:hypothetical protein
MPIFRVLSTNHYRPPAREPSFLKSPRYTSPPPGSPIEAPIERDAHLQSPLYQPLRVPNKEALNFNALLSKYIGHPLVEIKKDSDNTKMHGTTMKITVYLHSRHAGR